MRTRVCSIKDIAEEDVPYGFEIGEMRVVVVKLSGSYYVANSTCTHEEADLSLGILNGDILMCPLHQARFDIRTGLVINGPNGGDPKTIPSLKTYKTEAEDGELYIIT